MDNIPDDIVINNILPFLDSKASFISLSEVSKHFERIVFSHKSAEVWDIVQKRRPLAICIDGYCPTCRFVMKPFNFKYLFLLTFK